MAVLVCPFYLVAYVIQGMLTVCAAVYNLHGAVLWYSKPHRIHMKLACCMHPCLSLSVLYTATWPSVHLPLATRLLVLLRSRM